MASTIKVDNVQNQPGTNIINKCSTTITLGQSGDTISLASGASQTGFGRTGTVDWITTPKVTGDSPVTGVTGKGYFLNTTAGTITINLPVGVAGSIVSVADYAATWQTNAVTVAANGTEKIGGVDADVTLGTEGQSVTLVYVDSTQGWVNTMDSTSNVRGSAHMIATGGTISCCGNDKIHKFTGPGTFTVTAAALCAANNLVSYMVVAGGGGGGYSTGAHGGGAGGAGGFREVVSPSAPYTASPLQGYATPGNRITVTATGYPIAVGGGGVAGTCGATRGSPGVNSTFSTIIGAGGGGGGSVTGGPIYPGIAGGSGGGGGSEGSGSGGAGNTPPVTPAQGFAGGTGTNSPPDLRSGGGGGATAIGDNGVPGCRSGNGGAGATTCISASPTAYSGGGGGGRAGPSGQQAGGTGGAGGGAPGTTPESDATVNTGGGGGGGGYPSGAGGVGGSGVVIIRYKFQ